MFALCEKIVADRVRCGHHLTFVVERLLIRQLFHVVTEHHPLNRLVEIDLLYV